MYVSYKIQIEGLYLTKCIIPSLIFSISKHLVSTYHVPGTALDTGFP